MQIRLAGIVKESVVDGPGIRMTVFTQGCPHGCAACHNPHTHDMLGGESYACDSIVADFQARPLLAGLTISGGEPFVQAAACAYLAQAIRQSGRNIIVYSGYTWEQLGEMAQRQPGVKDLLLNTDILIDGPFVLAQRDLSLAFRGSTNQRIIDVPASYSSGLICELPW